jgi:hypothetical protein
MKARIRSHDTLDRVEYRYTLAVTFPPEYDPD